MPHLLKVIYGHHIKPLHVLCKELRDRNNIFVLHLAEARQRRSAWQLLQACHTREGHVSRYMTEFRPDEFGDIQQAVVVLADGDRCWDDHASGVYGLEDPLQVALPSHFFDEDWG